MKKQTGSRLRLLDTLRGITLISMIVYHAMWDVVYIYGVDFKWYRGNGAYIWQQAICWTFILLSGFCFSLGHSPLCRGLTVLICGTIVSAVTAIVMPSSLVMFGILTLMGSCMLIMIPLDKLFCRVIPEFGAAVSALIFILSRNIPRGYLGFEGMNIAALPESLYRNHITAYFGFPHAGFYSTDYFPLLPWLFLFIFGYFLHKILKKYGLCERLLSYPSIPAISFIGRNTLPIYMLHQPMIYGVCEIVFSII